MVGSHPRLTRAAMARVKSEGQGKRLVVSAFDMGEERSGEAFESSWIERGQNLSEHDGELFRPLG